MNVKDSLLCLANNIFPGLPKQNEVALDKRVLSNLPLQMALYFNVIFAPIWIVVILFFLKKNYTCYDELYKYITITVITTIIFVELLRLYLGYEGNLKDKIPELAGFWMLSILLQFPLQGFLLFNPRFNMYILEKIVQSVMFIMLCIQLITGYRTLKYFATEQSKMYQKAKCKEEIVKDINGETTKNEESIK